MGDTEYMAAFQHVLMPIFYEFCPDLVLVSAGFDSAAGDPLGGCKVSPAGFAYMTSVLKTLAAGKMVVALEGGYSLKSIAVSSEAVLRILMGEAPPPLQLGNPSRSAMATISRVQQIMSKYWSSLKVHPSSSSSSSYHSDPSFPKVHPQVRKREDDEGHSSFPKVHPQVRKREDDEDHSDPSETKVHPQVRKREDDEDHAHHHHHHRSYYVPSQASTPGNTPGVMELPPVPESESTVFAREARESDELPVTSEPTAYGRSDGETGAVRHDEDLDMVRIVVFVFDFVWFV